MTTRMPRAAEELTADLPQNARSTTAAYRLTAWHLSLVPRWHRGRLRGMPWRPNYGADSPFSGEERETIDRIVGALEAVDHPKRSAFLSTIEEHFLRLEAFGELLARFPSPLGRRTLGAREQNLESLTDALCRSTPSSFEFQVPTRALVGRALDMAESNFYRLLRHACGELLSGGLGEALRNQATDRLRDVVYTKLLEEVLTEIVGDVGNDRPIRRRAAMAAAQIWDRRLTYRTREFFPLLETTWSARHKLHVVGGTLLGTREMYGLFQEGCDPRFVDYFLRSEHSEEEVAAFREFLFGTSAEELDSLASRMDRASLPLVQFGFASIWAAADPGAALYEFFRERFLKAAARRLLGIAGPKHTAEGYVMIAFLEKASDQELVASPPPEVQARVT